VAGEGLPAPRKKVPVEVEHDQFYLMIRDSLLCAVVPVGGLDLVTTGRSLDRPARARDNRCGQLHMTT
jgi:hypothetical protein